jgi:hypothetical protein
MGIRGELFSTRFACDGRTYFFNVKQNRNGDVFLSVVESKPSEGETFDRRSIMVFGEHMEGFLKAFQSALKYIEKTGIKVEPDALARAPHRDLEDAAKPKTFERKPHRDAPRESSRPDRVSSYRDFDGPEANKVRRVTAKSTTVRSPETRKPATRSSDAPASSFRTGDKPVKRIVVRRPRKTNPGE